MEKDPKYFLIGLAIVIIFAGLGLFLLWSSKTAEISDKIDYSIYFKEQSPSGLQKDGLVTLKGLKVGSIKEIKFNPKNVEEVHVVISVDTDAPIKTDSRAIVRSNFVTGLSYIDLIYSSKEAGLLKNAGRQKLIIAEGKTSLEEIQNTLPEIIENISKILKQSERFFSEENSIRIANILKNTETVSSELAKESTNILSSFAIASKDLSKLTNELNSAIYSINKQTTKIAASSQKLIVKTGNKLEQTGDSITDMAQSIKQGKEKLLGPTEKNLLTE